MPNIVFNDWVKNVNKLWIVGVLNCVNSSTIKLGLVCLYNLKWLKMVFIRLSLLFQYTTLYTHLISKFNLLNKSFTYFPQHLLMNPIKEI